MAFCKVLRRVDLERYRRVSYGSAVGRSPSRSKEYSKFLDYLKLSEL